MKTLIFTESVITSVAPERSTRIADECLLEIRVVESRKEPAGWIYEYELKGEIGRIAKFRLRLKSLERVD